MRTFFNNYKWQRLAREKLLPWPELAWPKEASDIKEANYACNFPGEIIFPFVPLKKEGKKEKKREKVEVKGKNVLHVKNHFYPRKRRRKKGKKK